MSDAWRSEYPFQSQSLDLDGLRYHYVDEGSGPPLVMVHGNPTWSFYWRKLVLALRSRYRVIAVDHIGCGLSDKPQDYPYTLAQHTSNLAQLVERLDLRGATLLAHDWGGAIGLGAAVQQADRFARFILFNTGAFPPPYVPFRIRICRTPIVGRIALRGLNLFARAAVTMATVQRGGLPEPVAAGLLAPYGNWHDRVAIWRFVRDIPLTRRHPTYETLSRLEANLPQFASRPVQLIWGLQDWCFTTVCLDRFARLFPQAEIHRLDNAGHYVVEDAIDRIIPLVESFLTRTADSVTST